MIVYDMILSTVLGHLKLFFTQRLASVYLDFILLNIEITNRLNSLFYTTLIMSKNDLKRNSYWLRDRNKKTTGGSKSKLEYLQTTEHLSKHKNKIKFCTFVKSCITKAQKKKIMENSFRNLTASKNYSYPSMFWIL